MTGSAWDPRKALDDMRQQRMDYGGCVLSWPEEMRKEANRPDLAELTDEQLIEWQKMINSWAEESRRP